MGFKSLFRTPTHQQYRYVPRYYDPDKEELHARVESAKRKYHSDDTESMKSRISYGLRRGQGNAAVRKRAVLKSNATVFIITLCLLMAAGVFVFYFLDRILLYLDS